MSRRGLMARRIGAPRGGSGVGFGKAQAKDLRLYGLTSFSAANYLATSGVGGEPGVSTGFGEATLFRLERLPTAVNRLVGRVTGAFNQGWCKQINLTPMTLEAKYANGVGALITSPAYTFTASDVGKLFVHVSRHDGAGVLRAYISRSELGTGTACVGYTPCATNQTLGQFAGGQAAVDATILGELCFQGTPSTAQLQASIFDAARARGDLPETMDGATVTHRWSAKDELRGVSNPAGRKTYGARRFTDADYLSTTGGVAGAAGGFWFAYRFRQDSTGTAKSQIILSRTNDASTQGFQAYLTNNTVPLLSFIAANGSAFFSAPTRSIDIAAEPSRLYTVLCRYSGGTNGTVRQYVDGTDLGATVVTGTFAPYAGPMRIGRHGQTVAGVAADRSSVFELIGGDTALTDPEVAAWWASVKDGEPLPDIATKRQHAWQLGDASGVGASIPDTVGAGADALTRTGALELAVEVQKGPTSPTQLTDTQTRTTADALLKIGNPAVRIIDPSIDGRRTLGAQGFSLANYLKSANDAGVMGSVSGFHFVWRGQLAQIPSGSQILAGALNAAGSQGWHLHMTTVIRMYTGAYSASYTPVAGDVRRHIVIHGVYTGSVVRLYIDGVQIGADVAATFTLATGFPFLVGQGLGGNGATDAAMYECGGGTYVPTLAEIQQQVADSNTAGTLQPISAAKTPHLYRITDDVVASGVDAVPAQVLDRVGTDHLTRMGADVAIGGKQGLRLLGPVSPINQGLQTAPGGGIQGAASALTVSLLFSPLTNMPSGLAGGLSVLASKYSGSPTAGWDIRRGGTVGTPGTLYANIGISGLGNPGNSATPYTMQASDLGTLMVTAMTFDGSNLRHYVNGTLIATVAVAGSFAPAAVAMLLGGRSDGFASNSETAFFGISGGAYVATQAELAAQATASIAAGRLVAIAGKTDERRYNFDHDAVEQATALPLRVIDRMGNTNDPLVRIGSGLTLAQRTERVWSYETSPILYGVDPNSSSDYYTTAGSPLFPAIAAGNWAALLFMVVSQSGSAVRVPMSDFGNAATTGRCFTLTGTNTLFSFTGGNGVSAVASPTMVIGAGDVGKLLLAVGVIDPSTAKIRLYCKRVEQSTGSAFSGAFAPSSNPLMLLRDPRVAAYSAPTVRVFGAASGNGVPSLPEIQALHDACMSAEDIARIPGKTDFLVSFKTGAGSTLVDQINGDNLTRVGAPNVSGQYARASGW
jgi:hypothetical protein